MNYITEIETHYDSLTKSERKVADYILSMNQQVVSMTMHDIKQSTTVGDATIIRFCQKIGFSGFSDLKIEIAKEGFSNAHKTSSTEDYLERISIHLTDAIQSTRDLIVPQSIDEAINLIHGSTHLFLFGVGSSGNTCLDVASKLVRVGVSATAIVDPHFQSQNAAIMDEHSTIIAFSLSGKTRDIFDSLTVAKKNRVKIITVTNYLYSPVARISDVVLQSSIEEHLLNGGSFAGKISQLYVSDALITAFDNKYNKDSLKYRESVLRAIINKSLD